MYANKITFYLGMPFLMGKVNVGKLKVNMLLYFIYWLALLCFPIMSQKNAFDIEKIQGIYQNNPTLIPLVVIGSGPAGLSAALYTARAKIYTVIISGNEPGGQLMGSTYVENMPGVASDKGHVIIESMEQQAVQVGAHFLDDTIKQIEVAPDGYYFILHTEQGMELHALAIIIATGAASKRLEIPGESLYASQGVYTCAVCDCRQATDKQVLVIGGGDAAIEAVMHLAPYAQSITMLVRRDRMRASLIMQDKLKRYEHVTVVHQKQVVEIVGDDNEMTGAYVLDTTTNEKVLLPAACAFVSIGHIPNTTLFSSLIALDSNGYVELSGRSQETSYPGIFAAGDVADTRYKQAGSASGYGIGAALDAIDYLRKKGFSDGVARSLEPCYFKKVR